jgi:hypothetical protein
MRFDKALAGQSVGSVPAPRSRRWNTNQANDYWFAVTGVAGSFESIATTTVGAGGQATITFSDIPQTFKHLQLRIMSRDARTATANNVFARFNGDTATNYSNHNLIGDGSTAFSEGYTSEDAMLFGLSASNSAAANIFGVSIVDILDYANTNKYKTVRTLTGTDQNGSGSIRMWSSNWRSSSAVTSITLYGGTTPNLSQYSSFALYGIKG